MKEGRTRRKARNRRKQAYQTLLSGPLGCVPKIVEDQTRKTSSRLWRGVIALRRRETREEEEGENEADEHGPTGWLQFSVVDGGRRQGGSACF